MTFLFLPQEHYEAVMRRTLERSQQVDRQKRWSWGGLSTDSDGRTGSSCFLVHTVGVKRGSVQFISEANAA